MSDQNLPSTPKTTKLERWIHTGLVTVNQPSRLIRYTDEAIIAMHNDILRATKEQYKGESADGDEAPKVKPQKRLNILPRHLDHIFTTRPAPLQSALDFIAGKQAGSCLQALQHLTAALHLPTTFEGESHTILRFKRKPLSHSLHFTAGNSSTSVYVHNDADPPAHEFFVKGEEDLHTIARAILTLKLELTSGRGELRPRPRSNTELLDILNSGRGDEEGILRFAEAHRSLCRGNLLDAVVELLSPFALQPENQENKRIRVDLAPQKMVREHHKPVEIFIERLDRYLMGSAADDTSSDSDSDSSSSDSSSDSSSSSDSQRVKPITPTSSILITNLKTNDYPRALQDRTRQPKKILHGDKRHAYAELPKGLIYDLSRHNDVIAFVSRILVGREEVYAGRLIPFEVVCEEKGWGRKMEGPDYAARGSVTHARIQAARARRTNLSLVVSAEGVVDEGASVGDVMARKRDAEAEEERLATKIEGERGKLEESMDVEGINIDPELDRLEYGSGEGSAMGGGGSGEQKLSWADMEDEDELWLRYINSE